MQNHEGSVFHTRKKENRQSVTVTLQPQTIKRLDELAKRSNRTRSNVISLILDAVLLIIHCCDTV